MNPQLVWKGFLGIIFCVAFIYTSYTLVRLYAYYRTSETIAVNQIEWAIHSVAEDDVRLQAHYRFSKNQIGYEGNFHWPDHYLNPWAAEEARQRFSQQAWTAWVDPSSPDYSTLQKTFPTKQCISALILWSLGIYFVLLGHYVARYR